MRNSFADACDADSFIQKLEKKVTDEIGKRIIRHAKMYIQIEIGDYYIENEQEQELLAIERDL